MEQEYHILSCLMHHHALKEVENATSMPGREV